MSVEGAEVRYLVTGPLRSWKDVVVDGQGPVYDEREVYLIDAPTAKAAKWAAYRLARERRDLWWMDRGDEHPLTDTKARPEPGEDPSGWPGLYAVAP